MKRRLRRQDERIWGVLLMCLSLLLLYWVLSAQVGAHNRRLTALEKGAKGRGKGRGKARVSG